jgi:hypothetical protein
MALAVRAWRLRSLSRRSLVAGEYERALALAVSAQGMQGVPAGEALRAVSGVLAKR